ncbi:hypothetical protein Enr8_34060 [Blastopirellula retiformator]|uniref:Uncharacterized protein n=2 Tax=Blastopirellula retiformator TaxID=2527970 RepID=A0A5C5V1B0_9BACT|nr:hypothetical protein Enr8_34060 [Blastopirellula retiformator]
MGVGVYYVNPDWIVFYTLAFGAPLLLAAAALFTALLSKDENIRKTGAVLASVYAILMTVLGTVGVAILAVAIVLLALVSIIAAFGQACFDVNPSGN